MSLIYDLYLSLASNSAASLRKALTDSGLGSSVIGGGLSDELLQATWSIGLKGVAPEKVSCCWHHTVPYIISSSSDQYY
jgi:Zn-dependent M16 (insulinase) family peptidase